MDTHRKKEYIFKYNLCNGDAIYLLPSLNRYFGVLKTKLCYQCCTVNRDSINVMIRETVQIVCKQTHTHDCQTGSHSYYCAAFQLFCCSHVNGSLIHMVFEIKMIVRDSTNEAETRQKR